MRDPGFPTLVYIILEQQVSLASARAAFERLQGAVQPLTAKGFLELNDAELLGIGFSRQKTLYTRLLAESLVGRHFDLRCLRELNAPWRPWRAVAARLFWHAYLCRRGLKSATLTQ